MASHMTVKTHVDQKNPIVQSSLPNAKTWGTLDAEVEAFRTANKVKTFVAKISGRPVWGVGNGWK